MANLSVPEMFTFITSDFEDTWNALARDASAKGRGNFMFALHSMILLEWACRLCATDLTGKWIIILSSELHKIEPKYFTVLPGTCRLPNEFALPSMSGKPETELLSAIFDLIRNGQAHQYQQILAQLSDGVAFILILTGAAPGRELDKVRGAGRVKDHLGVRRDGGGLGLKIRPDWLYLDIKDAITRAGLPTSGLTFKYLERPGGSKTHYQYDSAKLEGALLSSGHDKV
jgi:hypothetical protein